MIPSAYAPPASDTISSTVCGGRIVAFANLWLTETRTEASVDLMRHRPDAPAGTMDFLFARLLLRANRADDLPAYLVIVIVAGSGKQ